MSAGPLINGRPFTWQARARYVAVAVGFLALVGVDVGGLVTTLPHLPEAGQIGDWVRLAAIDPGAPYASGFFRWAPPSLWIWQHLVVGLGFWPWFALHFAVLLLLRSRLAIAVILLSWPFWVDAINGSALTFVLVLAWLTLEGSTPATVLYVIVFALVPRPVMVPVLALVVWRRPRLVWLVTAVGLAVLLGSVAMGQLGDWLARLISTGPSESASLFNIAPSAIIGWVWVPVGLALAAWLLIAGHPGLASLAASPYWLSYYLLMLGLELRPQAVTFWRAHLRLRPIQVQGSPHPPGGT